MITVVVIIIELLFNYKRSFNEYQDTWPVFPHGLYDPAGEHKMRANKARQRERESRELKPSSILFEVHI